MAPRKTTRHGATANARKRAGTRSSRAASSSRPRTRHERAQSRKPAPSRKKSRSGRPGRFSAYVLPLAVVAICVILAWQFYPVMRVQYREAREKSRLEAQLSALKARNTKLRAQVDRLKTPEGVEEIARESLGLVKQGEHAVVIVDASREPTDPVTKAPEPAVETTDAPGPAGPFTPLLDAIFGVTN